MEYSPSLVFQTVFIYVCVLTGAAAMTINFFFLVTNTTVPWKYSGYSFVIVC